MANKRSYPSYWEPTLLSEEVLADGTWWYGGKIPHKAVLKAQQFDYRAEDLDTLERDLDYLNLDHINFAVNDDGVVYVWHFSGPNGKSESPSFSSLHDAREHMQVYGRVKIQWRDRGEN